MQPKRNFMTLLQYLLPVLLSCFTGWLTIWLAIKLLFRPNKPITIAGIKIQGFIPANQQMIAQKIGALVSKEFLSFAEIQKKVTDPENLNKLKPEIESHIDDFLRERLKDSFPMISMFVGDKTINQLKTAFLKELESLFPMLMNSYMTRLEKDLDLEKLITEKITGFSIEKAEDILNKSAKKQLMYLHLMGAGIGLIMGLMYIFINMQLNS